MSRNRENAGCFITILIIAGIVWLCLPDKWTAKLWYSYLYSVDTDRVHWNSKPSDCDWTYSPLGGKGCHYEKVVTGLNAAGQIIKGDGALRYRSDASGSFMISFDDGKTWNPLPPELSPPDVKVRNVEIQWTKLAE
jgi:hypothetical protein